MHDEHKAEPRRDNRLSVSEKEAFNNYHKIKRNQGLREELSNRSSAGSDRHDKTWVS
ncbi:uncharacterized protein METZ01_LOCUS162711 [marine metagenome]|uniref:Uncharacterized protein n=1 Tax=marine metagenome TaxID=408172 RepID=A0A382B9E2_9ZZZZ